MAHRISLPPLLSGLTESLRGRSLSLDHSTGFGLGLRVWGLGFGV